MPKGADLHMHLGGANYAENVFDLADKQGLCLDTSAMRPVVPSSGTKASCDADAVEFSQAAADQKLYDRYVNIASMRAFVPTAGYSGHDQFFDAFSHLGGVRNSTAVWLAEVAGRAADQNEQYLEVMASPGLRGAVALSNAMTWPADASASVSREELATLREALLKAGLHEAVSAAPKDMDAIEADERSILGCTAKPSEPACTLRMHYLYSVGRSAEPMQVFASALTGFELCSLDPRFVGINILAPEDGRVSMRDYHLHMQIFDYLHSIYPKVNITLHAGELTMGLVPPEGLRFHIREAVELGHAQRIGHGVDVLYEDDAAGLLREMAARHVMVEMNLTSNEGILGVKGSDHPLAAYRAAHVPVALSTDDEGVSRIDLTHEYVKGAMEQSLRYLDLKQMARTSLEHAFLHGESLWLKQDNFTARKPVCAAAITTKGAPSSACRAFLDSNERAAEEWEMERRFAAFEGATH